MPAVVPPYITNLVLQLIIKEAIKKLPEVKKIVLGEKNGQMIVFREEEENNSLILFIHGFGGNPQDTFKNVPELLASNDSLDGFDIFSMGYSTNKLPDIAAGIWSGKPDIDILSKYLITMIKTRFKAYQRICIVAHSMGGLVAQRAILDIKEEKYFNKITNFIMFGTPSNGVKIANSWFTRVMNRQTKDLGSKSKFITKLRADWKKRFPVKEKSKKQYPFQFYTVAGLSDEFIKRDSSLEVFEERYQYLIEGNHLTMVKANSLDDTECNCYQFILRKLSPLSSSKIQGTPFHLNQYLAEKKDFLAKHISKIARMDTKGLKKVALALDSLGQEDDAIELLENHPLSETDTDLMGIIGGRYKRKYLFDGYLGNHASKAFDYYKNGLEISQGKIGNSDEDQTKAREQIYYHAINLAFLSLIWKEEKGSMKKYAQLALDNCNINSKSYWEIATIAEANLYLDNDEEAKKYYTLFAEKTQDHIRERSSTFINAKFAYEALHGID